MSKFFSRKFLGFVFGFITLVAAGQFTEAALYGVGYFGANAYASAAADKAKALAASLKERLDTLESILIMREGGDV